MSDRDWDFYLCNVNSKPASIYVDLGLKKRAPDSSRCIALCIWVYFNHPNPDNGFSTQQEFEALCAIEDALSEAMTNSFSAIYAGRITNDGRREFYFYSDSSNDIEAKVQAALQNFSEFKFEAWAQPDAEWSQYLTVMYPTKNDLRWITDRRVTEVMEQQGDQLITPRPIEHYSYFTNELDRSEFEKFIQKSEFKIVSKSGPFDDDSSLGLIYQKTQAATVDAIFQTTGFLDEHSEHFNGEYDGWESIVVKQKKRWWPFGNKA
ncbi:DUF695 domain-containing protein [uncultured Deefgea sp.]|uniref:DUF695 domain-containing protein n=1 Tax=uncultured Deefgea sp. TaxID=1304914 RepID=UPI00261B4EFF|nr:DUF695 domain-containing protein [uncultured Deefgea sp.]